MYKYTRKELLKFFETKYPYSTKQFEKDLLAQKEDRKESLDEMEGRIVKIIKNWLKEDRKEKVELFNVTGVPLNTPIMFKRKNGRIGYGKVNPTPSPLEIEEIEEISDGDMRCLEDTRLIDKLWEKQCQIIRNQKKLYQYIKEKI